MVCQSNKLSHQSGRVSKEAETAVLWCGAFKGKTWTMGDSREDLNVESVDLSAEFTPALKGRGSRDDSNR